MLQSRGCVASFLELNGLSLLVLVWSLRIMTCMPRWPEIHACSPVLHKISTAVCASLPRVIIRIDPSFTTLQRSSAETRMSSTASTWLPSLKRKWSSFQGCNRSPSRAWILRALYNCVRKHHLNEGCGRWPGKYWWIHPRSCTDRGQEKRWGPFCPHSWTGKDGQIERRHRKIYVWFWSTKGWKWKKKTFWWMKGWKRGSQIS